MEVIGYFLSVFIGITLGLIGGGGSILTVPVLVYFFSVSPQVATTYSLFIVGTAALTGAYRHYRQGNLQLRSALLFSVPSIISILIIRKAVLPLVPDHLFYAGSMDVTKNIFLMIVFASLMIVASAAMIKRQQHVNVHDASISKLLFTGLIVGIVTGFLGAGGGFLIIPALMFFAALTMKQAVGTSLLIIAGNSLIGFTGDILQGAGVDYYLLGMITLLSVAGIFLGTALSKKIDGNRLKPAFGWFVLLMGVFIILKELSVA